MPEPVARDQKIEEGRRNGLIGAEGRMHRAKLDLKLSRNLSFINQQFIRHVQFLLIVLPVSDDIRSRPAKRISTSSHVERPEA